MNYIEQLFSLNHRCERITVRVYKNHEFSTRTVESSSPPPPPSLKVMISTSVSEDSHHLTFKSPIAKFGISLNGGHVFIHFLQFPIFDCRQCVPEFINLCIHRYNTILTGVLQLY